MTRRLQNPNKPIIRVNIWAKAKGKCFWCNNDLDRHTFTIDHLQPLSKKGQDVEANMVASCFDCNQKKRDHWNKNIRRDINTIRKQLKTNHKD